MYQETERNPKIYFTIILEGLSFIEINTYLLETLYQLYMVICAHFIPLLVFCLKTQAFIE